MSTQTDPHIALVYPSDALYAAEFVAPASVAAAAVSHEALEGTSLCSSHKRAE